MADTNCDETYQISEGDNVLLKTTEGTEYELTCTERDSHNARDPNVVQETTVWNFENDSGDRYTIQRIDGLKRFPDQKDYPYELPLAEIPEERVPEVESYGYIESVETLE